MQKNNNNKATETRIEEAFETMILVKSPEYADKVRVLYGVGHMSRCAQIVGLDMSMLGASVMQYCLRTWGTKQDSPEGQDMVKDTLALLANWA